MPLMISALAHSPLGPSRLRQAAGPHGAHHFIPASISVEGIRIPMADDCHKRLGGKAQTGPRELAKTADVGQAQNL